MQNTTEGSNQQSKSVEDYIKERRADSEIPMFYFETFGGALLLSEINLINVPKKIRFLSKC